LSIVGFKLSGRTLAMLLSFGFLMLVFLLMSYTSVPLVRDVHQNTQTESHAKVHLFRESTTDSNQKSTEAMWEHLTRPRIVLDGNEAKEKTAKDVAQLETKESKTETLSKPTRPAWVDHPPKRIGNVYRVAVSAGPYRDAEECHQALVPKLLDAVHQRIAQLTASGDPLSLDQLGLGLDFVLREICHEEWVESTERSYAEMKIVHVQLEFDAAVNKQLRTAIRDYQRESRITQVGGIAGLSLGGLALLFGLLKMDTWTRGDYTKRLFLGVPAVIIALLTLIFT